MILIYGLGNTGQQYSLNKHNIGILVLEDIALKLGLTWQKVAGGHWFKIDNNTLCFKSDGFMNNSGEKLSKFISYQKLPYLDMQLLTLQDDSDQQVGYAKLLQSGGAGGHKGVLDIYKYSPSLKLDLNQIWRLKIGIRPEDNKLKSETFVLSNISDLESKVVGSISALIISELRKNNLSNLINLQQIVNFTYAFRQTKPTKTE